MPTNEEIFLAGNIDKLYRDNTRFMHYLCRKFSNTNIEYDELYGLCDIAFMKAYKTFNATTSKWATYFSFVANNEILMHLRKQRKWDKFISINKPVGTDEKGNELTYEDLLYTDDNIEDDLINQDNIEQLKACIDLLPDKHKRLIELRLQDVTQKDLAEKLGLSQGHVSRLEKAIHKKLKTMLEKGDSLVAKKKKVQQPSKGKFIAPLRNPSPIARELQKAVDRRVLEESNNTLNLIASAYSIVLKEFFDFTDGQLKEALNKAYEQLELCAEEVVTIDQMMLLCEEYGLEVNKAGDRLDAFGTLMMKKVTAYELLDKGVEEVEYISKQGKMTSREASAFRWMYNKLKFGKDYEGEEIMASTRKLAYEMFDKGVGFKEAVEKLSSPSNTVKTYFNSWKREVLETLTTEEAAPYFAGEKELWQIKQEKAQGAKANEVVAEVPKAQEPVQETAVVATDAVKDEPVAVEPKKQEVSALVGSKPEQPKRKGLKKKVQLEGEFATYKPCNINLMDVELYGQVVSMTKEEALILSEELKAAADEDLLWKGVI